MTMVTRRTIIIAAAASVAACGDDKPPVPTPAPPPSGWRIGPIIPGGPAYSIGMPPAMTALPDGTHQFTFPTAGGDVDYVTRAPAPTEGRTSIRMRYRISGASAGFTATDGGVPAAVRLYIQRVGDNWSGQGPFASYRFWSAPQPLADGEHVLEGPIAGWTNVQGLQDEVGLQAALAALGEVGFTFGGQFAGHGVYSNAPGATFTMLEFSLQ